MQSSPVAIVGIAAQLPSGAENSDNLDHKQFFDFLLNKGEAYEKIPLERFNIDSFHGTTPGHVSTTHGTFLKNTSLIDHVELGITAKDAKAMSLSTRKLIELAFLSLLDSGVDYRGENVGCFASGIVFDVLSLSDPDPHSAPGSFSGPPAMLANRISYHLDLTGPSVPVDTACSSSLTATHLAVNSIRMGECDTAVVGGVQLNHRFVDWVQYSMGGILAPDGRCKPFDESADGFSRGEAGVAIVLKRLDHAIRDNDHIYATILGTGINSAGAAAPVNAPVAGAQRDAMRRAWAQTGRRPSEVDFVEVHATGTAAGDPAEANWVGEAFQRDDQLLIGSVKGNIGHTEIAAFLAGLTKVIHTLRTGIIPPNVGLSTPNPAIKWDEFRLEVPTEPTPLPVRAENGRALVALCSSGIGGANGHVVLEAPPVPTLAADTPANPNAPRLLVAGGLSPRTASAVADSLTELVAAHPDDLALIATVYGRRARQMTWRSFATYVPGQAGPPKFSTPVLVPRTKPPVVFVFAGQGPQHLVMGRELYAAFPVFRKSIDDMDAVYASVVGESLVESTALFRGGDARVKLGDIWPIAVTLPALAMLQCALVDLLASLGVMPDAVIGHSAGETAVLYASGAGSKAMVVELAIARGQAMAEIEHAGGSMAALSCGVADAQALIGDLSDTVDVACHNSPDAVTLAGPAAALDTLVARAKAQGLMATKLRTRVPVHSGMMAACHETYTRLVDAVFARHPGAHTPTTSVFSTLTGAPFSGPFTADYFWRGTLNPVLFTEATRALLAAHPAATLLELSPHPVLTSYIPVPSLPLLRRPARTDAPHAPVELPMFLAALGRFTTLGHSALSFNALNALPSLTQAGAQDFPWPAYPFQPKAVPYHSEGAAWQRQFEGRKGPLNYKGLRVNRDTHPVLAEHIVKGEPIMPAAGFIEMALEFGAMVLYDVEFSAMLSLSAEKPTPVQVALDGIHWTVKTSSARKDETFDKIHAQGFLSMDAPSHTAPPPLDLRAIQERCKRSDLTHFYDDLKSFADYGPAFQRVVDSYEGVEEALVLVRGADDDLLDIETHKFHPAILDACLHTMVHMSFTHVMDKNVYFLPSKVGRLVLEGEMRESDVWMFPEHVWTWVKFTGWGPSTITADFVITAIDGTRLCTLTDVEVTRHESVSTAGVAVAQRYDVVMQPLAVPSSSLSASDSDVLKEDVVKGSEVDMGTLHAYLDWLAAGVIRDTLAKGPVTGKELDRQRYAAFARAVAAAPKAAMPFDVKTIQSLENSWPEMMEITRRLASVHGKVFETSKAAVEVLYKDDIMTRFYKHYDWASLACAERFRDILSRISQTGGKRVVRVLEVGSGTGALTRHLAAVIASFPPESLAVEFVISDVSKELLPRQPYPWCRYTSFDLSKSAVEQGFMPASFDVITGFDVLHVVPDMAPALAQINELLVPGGSLLIGDLSGDSFAQRAPGAVYFDFVFGSFAEWFAFEDGREHCAMSGAEWTRVLGKAGFGGVTQARFESDPLLMTLEAQKVRELKLEVASQESMVFSYARGTEGKLRKEVLQRDASAAFSLWLFSSAGFSGDAGAGLARSLGREFPLWNVHFVAFDGPWTETKQRDFVLALSRTPTAETYIQVSPSGDIFVPRVVPSSTPPTERPFSPSQPWTKSDSGAVVQTSIPQPTIEMATVQILAMSPAEKNIRGFVGCLTTDKAHLVVGVAYSPAFSNFLSVPRTSLATLPSSAKGSVSAIAGFALGALIGSLAIGSSPRVVRGRKALLSHMGPVVGPALRWYLALLGLNVVEPKIDTPAEIAALGLRFDVVVAGSDARADVQGYARALKRSGKMLVWSGNSEEDGVLGLLRHDPAAVGEAMERTVRSVKGRWPCSNVGFAVDDVDLPPVGTLVPSEATLFDPTKAYILVGGIGGLGIRIALWMYERGARYLVLTSRSGRDTLTRVQDRLALRIVDHLDSLPDLTLRLEASDAISRASTSALMRSIPVPVGGCMLLSVVLSDRTFAFQEENDFNKVFASKTGACRVIESCLPNGVASLDFFVAFSSVVGLFGNGGQTNYSSANTALDGIVREWDNAFTFVLPAISDGGGLASETGEQGGRLGHLTPWGMSAQRVCACLEDGIRKLGDGPFWQYIPDLDWTLVQKYMGTAPLYSHLVGSTTEEGPAQTADSGKSLQDIVMELLDVDASEFSADVPFTAYGLDSLSAARLSLALRPHVAISQLQLLSDVCLNDLLARAEAARDEEQVAASSQTSEEKVETNPKVAEIEDMISKYTHAFRKHTGNRATSPAEGDVVLVTGTTGAIGTAMLARLATMPSVTRVYAFNRKSEKGSVTLRERQAASFESRGYNSCILNGGKIVLVEGDQSVTGLGISSSLYDEIRDSVTSIIHNAWPVNFTASLASLEPAVRSVRVMVDLALRSSRSLPPRLLFLSSIGLLYNRKGAGAAPEELITDVNQVIGTGYSESKYVGERILQKAAEETALRPVVVRAGQICGGPNGSWSTSEWFPSLVKSSVHLECLPEMQGDISWVPLQGAADALIDMRNADQQTLHISHPRPVSGSLISGSLSKALNLPLVPYSEWLARLQRSAGDDRSQCSIDANPAIGLLDYFRTLEVGSNASKEALGLPKLSVAAGVNASSALRGIESLTTEHADQWLANWRASGFITCRW